MGLDITYYRKMTEAKGNEAFDETGDLKEDEDWFQVYVCSDFPGREDGLKHRHAYKAEDSARFHVGGYGGYNQWREQLAELAGWAKSSYMRYEKEYPSFAASAWAATSGPFWELICFSDCEGVIGPVTSAKLAKDFAQFQSKADLLADERFRSKYNEWRKAFEYASEGGAVCFH